MGVCKREQNLENRKRSSRPAETQTSEYYFRNQKSPRPASANPACLAHAAQSPPTNASCTLQDFSLAAPAPLPASSRSARTRSVDHARWFDRSTNPAARRVWPAPELSPRNFQLTRPKSLLV